MANFFTLADLQVAPSQDLASSGGIPAWAWFLIIVVIILLVWWLLVRSAERQNEIEAHPAEEHAVEAAPAHEAPQVTDRTAEIKVADDLTVLEGIGPKVRDVLSAGGITTFAQLAETDVTRLKELLDGAGFKYMDPATWPEQASLLAAGKRDEFEALVSGLKGGRARG